MVRKELPIDDDSRSLSGSELPREMIDAGATELQQIDEDLRNYVAGKSIDWDYGMAAVAVYRAMTRTAINLQNNVYQEAPKDENN